MQNYLLEHYIFLKNIILNFNFFLKKKLKWNIKIKNSISYDVIMSDVFCDDEYYETCRYLYEKKYVLPAEMLKDIVWYVSG